MDESVEVLAIRMAHLFFQKNGWEVIDVSHSRGDHAGYDLSITKGSKLLKVEVKGSRKAYYGIPDLYGTEVNENQTLIADLLCVGYFPPGEATKLAILRRSDFPADAFVPKIGYRIRNEYKNQKRIAEHLLDVDQPWKTE